MKTHQAVFMKMAGMSASDLFGAVLGGYSGAFLFTRTALE